MVVEVQGLQVLLLLDLLVVLEDLVEEHLEVLME
jgi:hypothetical protein